jgi:hypothetical protein
LQKIFLSRRSQAVVCGMNKRFSNQGQDYENSVRLCGFNANKGVCASVHPTHFIDAGADDDVVVPFKSHSQTVMLMML